MPATKPTAPADRALPVVVRKAPVNLGVLARHVGEHGLVEVDLTRGHREGRRAQRQEHQGNEVGGHGHGADVQGEVDKRTQAGSQDKQQVAALVIAGRKRPLPQKRHARASQSLQDSRANNQVDGYLRVHVHGGDEGEAASDHRRGGKLGHHARRQRGGAIGAHQAGDVRAHRSCCLRSVERQRDRDGLELKREKGKDAAPHLHGADCQEEGEAPTGDSQTYRGHGGHATPPPRSCGSSRSRSAPQTCRHRRGRTWPQA